MRYTVSVMVKERWVKGEWYITDVEVEADNVTEAGELGVFKVKDHDARRGWARDNCYSCWAVHAHLGEKK